MIGKCTDVVVNWLIRCEVVEISDKELYRYALYSIFLSLSPLLLAIGFGIGMGCVDRSLLIIIPFVIIRKYSGGYHTKKSWSCLAGSSFLLLLCIKASFYLKCGWLLAVLTIGATVSLIYFSPIDNENMMLSKDEKLRYKRITIVLVFLILFADILFFCLGRYTYSVCVSIGIMLSAGLQLPCILGKGK